MTKSSEQLYYIQDSRSYSGNDLLWYREGGGNYTTNIKEAALFTEEEALNKFKNRNTDIPWKKEEIDASIIHVVDSQYLSRSEQDPFYSQLNILKEEQINQRKIEQEKNANKDYVEIELPNILDYVSLEGVSSLEDFESNFYLAKNNEEGNGFNFDLYDYPISARKEISEIFNDLIKFQLIFACDDCSCYFKTFYKNEDYKEFKICDDCAEERYYKENPEG